jgi:hypothetical protein
MKTMKFELPAIFQEGFRSILRDLELQSTVLSSNKDIAAIEVKYSWVQIPIIRTIRKILASKSLPFVLLALDSDIDKSVQNKYILFRKKEYLEEQAHSEAELERLTKLTQELEARINKGKEEKTWLENFLEALRNHKK